MSGKCSICRHPESDWIVAKYIATDSLRVAAEMFGVGYNSLHRHIKKCLPKIRAKSNELEFFEQLEKCSKELTEELNLRFNAPRLDMRRPRPKPMVTKKVEFTWSRRAWTKQNTSKN